jgi:hypothetical protein
LQVRVIGHNGELEFPFANSVAWEAFSQELLSAGYKICGANPDERMDLLIANFHSEKVMTQIGKNLPPKARRHLILWEPEVVETTRYTKQVLKQYGHVYAPSMLWAKKIGGTKFNWPQGSIISDVSIFTNWFEREHKVVIIQGNKFSSHKGELYSLRRRIIKSLQSSNLSLYGTDWNRGFIFDLRNWLRSAATISLNLISLSSLGNIGSRYYNYNGEVNDKHATLLKYQISLVVENSADFVSEKLFDSLRAGCVTVYIGPSLETFGIPESAAIQVQAKVSKAKSEIKKLLRKSPQELLEIATSQRAAIEQVSHEWDNIHVLSNLAKRIIMET